MKLLAFFLLFAVASASFHEALDDAVDEFVLSFLEGMEHAPSLSEHFREFDSQYTDAIEIETKTEIGKRLKEVLEKVLERVKEALEEGKFLKGDFLEKIQALKEKMKELKVELGGKSKELIEKIKDRAREYLKQILEKLGTNKRAADDRIEEALSELNFKDVLEKLKEHLKKTVDPELLKVKLEKIFGQGSALLKRLLEMLKEKGKKKLMILIDQLLDDVEDEREARGISDYWDKIKNYFKDLKIDLQEKYAKFGEWVKDALGKGMERSKDKMDNIRAIANEFVKHAKGISKEIAAEAGEFFKNYKDELGNVWDEIKEKINDIKNRKD